MHGFGSTQPGKLNFSRSKANKPLIFSSLMLHVKFHVPVNKNMSKSLCPVNQIQIFGGKSVC